ncbi:MAG: hypothetical protein KDD69_20280, partial [Bdellovibrionales bacterium]|nr:hypothetical protein [Bdellovibrionales bacterium]
LGRALNRPEPDPRTIARFRFVEHDEAGEEISAMRGGLPLKARRLLARSEQAQSDGARINMLEGIRKVLEHELRCNPAVVLFGEDVGPKGGVHAATRGLQELFGEDRVFDTSLSEEGIIGRAVGMALAGLLPIPEIQFRKYADPAMEQLNNCGTIRWRTANRFAAPIVVRMAGGFARRAGDPWHSVSGEAVWLHQCGWCYAVPSNAEDAVGLLRYALREANPTIFFEHRALLDAPEARRPYPGDAYVLPFGRANVVQAGEALTVVTWGAMVERSLAAAETIADSIEVIDLRTLCPWDSQSVFNSVRKTKRCLIVHEDGVTVGFGAEIAAQLVESLFEHLDAPIRRIAPPCLPIPYNRQLMNQLVPAVDVIAKAMQELLRF